MMEPSMGGRGLGQPAAENIIRYSKEWGGGGGGGTRVRDNFSSLKLQ